MPAYLAGLADPTGWPVQPSTGLPVFAIPNLNYKIQPIFVSDVVSAIIKIIEEKNNFKKIYEIGGPKIFTMREMITSIMKIIGKKDL